LGGEIEPHDSGSQLAGAARAGAAMQIVIVDDNVDAAWTSRAEYEHPQPAL